MANKTKLELTWIGKDKELKLEPRILIERPELSFKSEIENENATHENILIHGDNLLALKALEQDYAGKIKCIYIDPPYNTGNAFEHYDDNLEHSIWLNLMKPRLEVFKNLLSESGLIFIQIDDAEQAYLKVLCDEVFGRGNFINMIVVNMSNLSGVKMTAAINGKRFPKIKEYILIYAKNKDYYKLDIPKIPKSKWDNEYNYIIPEFTREMYDSYTNSNGKIVLNNIGELSLVSLKKFLSENNIKNTFEWKVENSYRIVATKPNHSLYKRVINESFKNDLSIVKNASGKNVLIKSDFNKLSKTARLEIVFAEKNNSMYLGDQWSDIVTTGGVGKEGGVFFPNGKKPEKLIHRILYSATQKNDIVLDSFLGSGSTAAVAHKMGRKWIGIELGDHAYTHCKPRLDSVLSGTDQGGISKGVNWLGGGSYKFYELAPTLIKKDAFGNPVINKEYNAEMLAAAMAKHENYQYDPNPDVFWKQGKSSENAYIYTTTQLITLNYLTSIHSQMKEGEHLVIACKTFEEGLERTFKNITIKKIPNTLLGRCEFGKDNYNLNIISVPQLDEEESDE